MKRLANWLFAWVLRNMTGPEQGKIVYGVTTDSQLHLSDIPVVLPKVGGQYTVATDLRPFEVVGGSRDTGHVQIMEQDGSVVFPIDAELFELLFVKHPPDDTTA